MPKKPVDYSKVVIYKIVCNDLNVSDCYVGHTTDFKSRKNCHKSKCNNENVKGYNSKVYKSLRENGGWNNWSMIEIEKYPCNDAHEARAKEREWYEKLSANLNFDVPGRSMQEYLEKFTCHVCGGSYNRIHIKQHQETYKHQKAIKGLKDTS